MTTELHTQYQEALRKIQEANEQARQIGRQLFRESAELIFNKYPTLESFGWTQYTPYFNDGDECVFSVNGDYPEVKLSTGFSDWVSVAGWRTAAPDEPEEVTIAREARDLIQTMDYDSMKSMFGDHARVTVNRGGYVETEQYDHD